MIPPQLLLTQEISLYKRIETLEPWVKSYIGGIPNNTLGFTMSELEGRLLKRITHLETQLTRINVQELPNRQRELEAKLDKLFQTDDLPSFGTSTSSKTPTSLELRLNKMEINQENLVTENKKLQARLSALEESRTLTTIRQIMDRLDSVIRVVNDHESESFQIGQSINDVQHEVIALRQAVDSWNEDEQQAEPHTEEQPEDQHQSEVIGLHIQEGHDTSQPDPPGLSRSASMAGSATTIIVSALELPLFKGSKRVFVRDAHLFVVGKYVVIDRWFVSLIIGRGSIIIEDPAPRDFPPGTSVRTTGQDDEWTMDENGRMFLNGIPTNIHSGQRNDTPGKRRFSKHLLPLLANNCWKLRMMVLFI